VARDHNEKIGALNYPVLFGTRSLTNLKSLFLADDNQKTVFVLTDENTRKYCLPILTDAVCGLGMKQTFTINPGEPSKTMQTAAKIIDWLVDSGAGKEAILVNLGGGVVTDLGGFVASIYKRGIAFINIPTTLMGMADAAIGGKTAVNSGDIKNQIGTFYDPDAVLIFPGFLDTLPASHLKSGYAEIIKCAILEGGDAWDTARNTVSFEDEAFRESFLNAIRFKCRIVSADPYDKSTRQVLNFGHTFGHAFESLFSRSSQPLLHGEAIAAGMICETYLSFVLCGLGRKVLEDLTGFIAGHFRLPALNGDATRDMNRIMAHDKKNRSDEIRFTLLRDAGNPLTGVSAGNSLVNEAFLYYSEIAAK